MKTREQAHKALDAWIDGDYVGNIVFFRAPHSSLVDCVCERVIKTREMNIPERAAFENFVSMFPNVAKGEFWNNSDGNPDRVKIVVPIDDLD